MVAEEKKSVLSLLMMPYCALTLSLADEWKKGKLVYLERSRRLDGYSWKKELGGGGGGPPPPPPAADE